MQLTYGDDGLDPVAMEAQDGKPVDLARSMSVVHATTPRLPPLPENAMEEGVSHSSIVRPYFIPTSAFHFHLPHLWDN